MEKFIKKIRPYLDTSEHKLKDGTLCHLWPLVREVKLFIRSPILKNGIVLHDMPGEGDTVDSRSQIARELKAKMKGLIVVGEAMRIVDNSMAHNLIPDDQLLGLELDGKRDSLIIVASRSDSMGEAKSLAGAAEDQDCQGPRKDLETLASKAQTLDNKIKASKKRIKDLDEQIKVKSRAKAKKGKEVNGRLKSSPPSSMIERTLNHNSRQEEGCRAAHAEEARGPREEQA